MAELRAALRFARRELRGGLAGFRIFVACLALGVAAIAGVNSLSQAVEAGLRADARQLAGGDAVIRTTYSPADEEQQAWFAQAGTVSRTIEMRAMGAAGERRSLVELKAVDGTYPLYGTVALAPRQELADALARRDGEWGAAVDQVLLHQLDVAVGDTIRIGDLSYRVRATIGREPDRATGLFSFGPRFMVGADSLEATGLIQPGSLVQWHYHLRLPDGASAGAFAATAEARYPDAAWRIRTHDQAAPGLRRMLDRLTLFLTLVGVTALLVGGIGVANAVRSYLAGKTATIATLKCIGAPGRVVFLTYFLQVGALALLGIAIGLAVGAAVPPLAAGLLARLLPVAPAAGIYPGALGLAALFGALTAVVFSLLPLARAQELPPATLFRDLVAQAKILPRWPAVAATLAIAALLAAVIVASAPEPVFAAWFVAGAVGALILFLGTAVLVVRGAAAFPRPRTQALR
ncbi:MAG: ABC transporter permease, partial [Alphaproteobacteria bacterium]